MCYFIFNVDETKDRIVQSLIYKRDLLIVPSITVHWHIMYNHWI